MNDAGNGQTSLGSTTGIGVEISAARVRPVPGVRTALLVVGMHRSGTSALARTLSLLGCDLPRTLIPGRTENNEDGFWESERVVEVNKEILASAGSRWNDWTPFSREWPASPVANAFRERALALLEEEVGASPFFVLKDPRFCRLLSFWLDVLKASATCAYVITPIRNPVEVAASITKRDGMEPSAAQLFWLRNVLDAEAASRGTPRSFVRYKDLLTNWEMVAQKLSDDLGIAWPRRSAGASFEIEAFLSPDKRHFRERDATVLASRSLSPWIRTTFEILGRWASGDVRAADTTALDEIRSALDEAAPAFERLFAVGQSALKRNRDLEARLVRREAETKELEATLADVRAHEAELGTQLQVREAETKELEATLADAQVQQAELEAQLHVREAETRDLEATLADVRARDAELMVELNAREAEVKALDLLVSEREQSTAMLAEQLHAARVEARKHQRSIRRREADLTDVYASASWRLTAPLRAVRTAASQLAARGRSRGTPLPGRREKVSGDAPRVKRDATASTTPAGTESQTMTTPAAARHALKAAAVASVHDDEVFQTLGAMVGRPPEEVHEDLARRKRDVEVRLHGGILGEMARRAAELEPLVMQSWGEALNVRLHPFYSKPVMAQMVAMNRLHEEAHRRRARNVVVIPHCRLGGATRIAGYLASALAELYGQEEVLVVRTDRPDMRFPQWFPDGCRHVNFATVAEHLAHENSQRLLAEFLRSLHPEAIFNANSRLLWHTLGTFGRPLSSSSALYAYLFCNEITPEGYPFGYPAKFFYRHFDLLTGVFTDSEYLAHELRTSFQLPTSWQERVTALATPASVVSTQASAPDPSPERRRQIFWAGRFDRQKRVDVVLALARRHSDVTFRLWGEPVLGTGAQLQNVPANVKLEGVYGSFDELPLHECDLWLYTSEWDGVPNILLEVIATGVPLVSSVAGGSGEVLPENLAERVVSVDDIDAFEAAIRRILEDPWTARERALRLREQTLAQRTSVSYREALKLALARSNGGPSRPVS